MKESTVHPIELQRNPILPFTAYYENIGLFSVQKTNKTVKKNLNFSGLLYFASPVDFHGACCHLNHCFY